MSNLPVFERNSGRETRSCRDSGFSLLEVIVALALATVLLGSVWSLFQILTRRQAIELRQAESNQVIRSLHQRFTRDLNNLPAIERQVASSPLTETDQDSAKGGSLFWPFKFLDGQSSEGLSKRSAVLRGDQSTLSLAQFVEPVEWEQSLATTVAIGQRRPESGTPQPIKEVVYHLPRWPKPEDDWERTALDSKLDSNLDSSSQSRNDGEGNDEEFGRPMLVREENLPDVFSGNTGEAVGSPTTEAGEFIDREPTRQGMRSQGFSEQNLNGIEATIQRETLEDISVAAFAYFDGTRWRNDWDTDLEQRLPVAIRFRWRQSALPTTETGDSSADFSSTMPAEFLERAESGSDPDLDEASAPIPAGGGAAENLETRWYEGEWIFLLQPSSVPAGSPAESGFGFEWDSLRQRRILMDAESGTVGGRHG